MLTTLADSSVIIIVRLSYGALRLSSLYVLNRFLTQKLKVQKNQNGCICFAGQEQPVCHFSAQKIKSQALGRLAAQYAGTGPT